MDPLCFEALQHAHPEGRWLLPLGQKYEPKTPILGLSLDSRKVQGGDLFVALKGQRFDAHDYLEEVVAQNPALLMLSSEEKAKHFCAQCPVFLVQDTQKAYRDLAHYYRQHFIKKLIAVTGSVGKTSTREMIAGALQNQIHLHKTKENLNNEIGVPGTILAARGSCDAVLLEMGMDHAGDLRLLTHIAEPDLAVITNIGYSHIENLGSQEAILQAKAEILEGLRPGGQVLLYAQDRWLLHLAQALQNQQMEWAGRLSFVAREAAEGEELPEIPLDLPGPVLIARNIQLNSRGEASFEVYRRAGGQERKMLPRRIELPTSGLHHIINALFALQCADLLGLDFAQAAEGLGQFQNVGNRQKMMEARGVTLINDAYNAAPESMKAALINLDYLGTQMQARKIAVLGCIAELGEHAAPLHYALGQWMAGLNLQAVYACGAYAQDLRQGYEDGLHCLLDAKDFVKCSGALPKLVHPYPFYCFHTREELEAELIPKLQDHDLLLIKGSHAYRMDLVCEHILSNRLEEQT